MHIGGFYFAWLYLGAITLSLRHVIHSPNISSGSWVIIVDRIWTVTCSLVRNYTVNATSPSYKLYTPNKSSFGGIQNRTHNRHRYRITRVTKFYKAIWSISIWYKTMKTRTLSTKSCEIGRNAQSRKTYWIHTLSDIHDDAMISKQFPHYGLRERNPLVIYGFPSQRDSSAELNCYICYLSEQAVELPVISDAMTSIPATPVIWRHCKAKSSLRVTSHTQYLYMYMLACLHESTIITPENTCGCIHGNTYTEAYTKNCIIVQIHVYKRISTSTWHELFLIS